MLTALLAVNLLAVSLSICSYIGMYIVHKRVEESFELNSHVLNMGKTLEQTRKSQQSTWTLYMPLSLLNTVT